MKKNEDMFIRFDKMYERDRQTHGHRMKAMLRCKWSRTQQDSTIDNRTTQTNVVEYSFTFGGHSASLLQVVATF